jgi:microcystin-dependent protein
VSSPFVGEIRAVPYNFAPRGWAMCNGQLLPISQNTALFSLLGTFYGGDGKSTFALPNLQAQFPLHAGNNPVGLTQHFVGDAGGQDAVTLDQTTMPAHSHQLLGVASAGNTNSPGGAALAEPHFGRLADQVYATGTATSQMSPQALSIAGSSLPHNNLPPYLALNFIIAMQGIFPPRS